MVDMSSDTATMHSQREMSCQYGDISDDMDYSYSITDDRYVVEITRVIEKMLMLFRLCDVAGDA